MEDLRGRALRDLRISVTDRCNFRCTYCMPREAFGPGHAFLPAGELLSFDEITELATVFARLGVTKLRLTGGEPLLRPGLPDLVRGLAAIDGIDDLALTTNASLLAGQAQALADAGLSRVTVSLDSLDPGTFAAMADTKVPLADVLAGIEAAAAAGLGPVKLNAVVRRGVNESSVPGLVAFARDGGHVLRFIEFMDVGSTNGWLEGEVVPATELLATVDALHPLVPVGDEPERTARRYRYADGRGELGIVASVTQPFCSGCTRARLTAAGELFTCLFATRGTDLRAVLRGGGDVEAAVGAVWAGRDDRYSELRGLVVEKHKPEMSYLGG